MNLDESFETFLRSGIDSKGRTVGFVVGLRQDLESPQCYAWVQKSIMNKDGTFKNWGANQRSRLFPTASAAKQWAYSTAKQRMQA